MTEGKRRVRAAFHENEVHSLARGLKAFGDWTQLATQWKLMMGNAQKLFIKRALVHKWRVEFMKLAAQRKRVRDGFRRVVDPEGAAKLMALERLEELLAVKRMFERADLHRQGSYFKRRWLTWLEEKRAFEAKLAKVKKVNQGVVATQRFWAGLEAIMQQVRSRRRAASAFLNIAPRRAISTWRAMLAHVMEGRKQLVWLCMRTGTQLELLKRILESVGPAQREEMLLNQTDAFGQTPLHWAAKGGRTLAVELVLSFGGRLGNNANTKDLLTAIDMYGLNVLHYAVRAGHNDVCNTLLVLASTLGFEIVNAANDDGSTALHWAARKNNAVAIRMLLHHGADKTKQNKWGASPLDNATKSAMGAHHAVAELSSDAAQVQAALKSAKLESTLRVTEEEIARRKQTLEEVMAARRNLDKATLISLRDARNEGWLGWHQCKQEPELVVPERRMENAHVALTKALDPRPQRGEEEEEEEEEAERPVGAAETPREQEMSRDLAASPQQSLKAQQDEDQPEGDAQAFGLIAVTPPPRSASRPARSPSSRQYSSRSSPSSRSSRGARPWLGHTTAEASELLRAMHEATSAGNHNSGDDVYEACVLEATRVLSLLKRDGRCNGRTPLLWRSQLPPPATTEELSRMSSARREAAALAIQAAVEAAQVRAQSPPKSITSLTARPKSARLKAARLKKTPNSSRQPGTPSSSSSGAPSSSRLTATSGSRPSKGSSKSSLRGARASQAPVPDSDGGTPPPKSKRASRSGTSALSHKKKLEFEHCPVPGMPAGNVGTKPPARPATELSLSERRMLLG